MRVFKVAVVMIIGPVLGLLLGFFVGGLLLAPDPKWARRSRRRFSDASLYGDWSDIVPSDFRALCASDLAAVDWSMSANAYFNGHGQSGKIIGQSRQ
jgi:hypothetical protein